MEDATVDLIVNPCNVVGVMGAGLALALKNKYPDHFRVYKKLCDLKELSPREVVLVSSGATKPRGIILFPTKVHWKGKSETIIIDHNLKELRKLLKEREVFNEVVGLPAVGCGLGGLNAEHILEVAEFILRETTQEVRWYE